MNKSKASPLAHMLFLGPASLVFVIAVVLPFLISFYYSLTDWNGVAAEASFIGLKNFVGIFTGKTAFLDSFWFTFRAAFASVLVVMVFGTLIAAVLSEKAICRNFFRLAFYMPYTIGGIVLGYVWQFIFAKGVPAIGEKFNIDLFRLPWLGQENTAFWAIVIVFSWQFIGYVMVIMIAGFTSIPEDVLESANIDGASKWKTFFKIKLPLCMPYISICLYWTISNAFRMFEINMSLTAGGPYGSTTPMALRIYNDAFLNNRYGLATAESMIFFLIIIAITTIQNKITSRKERDLM